MKHCNRCDTTKSLDDFYRDKTKRDGRSTKCKQCSKTFKTKLFRTKTEKFCPRCKATLPIDSFDLSTVGDGYQTACKTCRNLVKRLSNYQDFDWNQFHKMMESQQGRCRICNKAAALVIDHCHKTGKVRGLLCHHCNIGLGAYEDNERVLLEAVRYLRESRGLPSLP